MNHRNLYTEVKPIINRISNHNIEDNLRCIRYYIKESFHSIYNNEDSSKGIENKDAVLIPAYMADFLFVQTLRNGNWVSKISLFNYKERFKVLKNLQVIQEGLNLDCIHDNLEAWLKSSVYTQMKMQNPEHPVFALYRHYYLYSNLKLKNEGQLEEIDVFYYYLATICIYSVFDKFFKLSDDQLECFKNTIANSELKRHFCFVLEQLRIKFQELQEYIRQDKNLFNADRIFASFGDSKYINRPLIYKDGFTFCVFPNMLLNVSIDYLYYTVTEKTSLGPIFEDYVNEQLEYYIQNKKFDFVREISYYDKSPKKTSDFILWDRDQLVFLDCKMKRITENGKHDLNVDTDFIEEVLKSDWYTNKKWEKYVTKNVSIPPFTKDFIEMGKDLGKIFRSYDDLCEDKYKVVDGITEKRFKAVILTFSPWVILDYTTLAKIAEWYRNKGKKDKKSVHFTDIAIISATDFDECISIISEDFSIFVSNLEHNHNNKECVRKENSYLNNKVKEFHEELYKQMKFCL